MISILKRKSREDIIIDVIIFIVLTLITFLALYPFYFSFITSFNNGIDASKGGVYFWPRMFTLDNYMHVFNDKVWLSAFSMSVFRTVVGTSCSLLFTSLFAYALSFDELIFKKVYFRILIFSMYFSGGLIPYFVLLRSLHLIDNVLVYIIPLLLDSFMTLVMISFFRDIPRSLHESAKMDGANDLVVFFRIIIPLSLPVLSTAALFMGVGQWNNWFDATFFIQSRNLKTLSFFLMEIINKSQTISVGDQGQGLSAQALAGMAVRTYTPRSLQMATMIVAVTPILLVYPFVQKYFVKGILLGAVKE